MRMLARLLVLPVLIGRPDHTGIMAQIHAAPTPTRAAAGSMSVSVRWNRLVPAFADEDAARRSAARTAAAGDAAALRRIAQDAPPFPMRVYTILSVAQYAAVNAARDHRDASPGMAVASASATVLTALFADSAVRASIARALARDGDQARTGSRGAARISAGRSLGDQAARGVIAWAPPFNLVAPWKGTIPTGPSMWYSAPGVPPIGIMLATARGWLLDSAPQFRPAPPPDHGSPAWQAALDEVRRVARERTPDQTAIAQKWNAGDPWTEWNATASTAIRRHHLPDAEAVRVLAVMNVAASDAVIACFDAKYHYWTIRPSQADTTLVLAEHVGLPNFPSFPSGHACSAGAFDAALGHYFPDERAAFTRIAEEQAMSRLYGGIHYRFDNDGGLALGRVVARHDVERERHGGLNAWRTGGVATQP